ncbi:MGMT family protein [Pyxidicoccus sp. MSG2]|uniref:MGMT family protein n=1 Tax=Pyxidicoccus sp. MSG2 TaxID=2996790 RepID=UPI002271DB0F|nr:MGMT family protein [Pyxidicoccus sp. MSG2]MCY1021245.1 MGMT family protein [Pyxidicoccus sp. MSG2]
MATRAKRQKSESKVKPGASSRRGTRPKLAGGAARPEVAQSGPEPRPLFSETVFRAVRAIPRGQVRSYAQVALYAGRPGAARGVGHELTGLPPARQRDVPWWRVIRSDGTLAPMVAHEQAKRLRAEGVEVRQRGEVFRVKVDDGRG